MANCEPPSRVRIDAINLRIAYDPRIDSIHVTTGVGPTTALKLASR